MQTMMNYSGYARNPFVMPTPNPRFQIAALKFGDSLLEITWQDNHRSRYPGIWLLEACNCKLCGNTETAVRHTRLTQKHLRPEFVNCRYDDSSLDIDWGGAHGSRYDLKWLRTMCLSPQARRERKFKPSLWGSEMVDRLPYFIYDEVSNSDDLHQQFLESILNSGFAILRNVPAAREQTTAVTSLVGKMRLTNYEIYELESKPNPEIVGDMAVPLAPHTDEPYRIDPPAITFFHVIAHAEDGGASTLIDSFHLVDSLKQRNPAAFGTLNRVSARFHRSLQEGRLFEYQNPIIQTDSDGDLTSVRLLDRALAPVDCTFEEVEEFYLALRELLSLSYAGDGLIEFKLHAGEMLVFNNQRLMHGRTAFNPTSSKRHIRSCHVDLDEFYSRLRILYAKRQDPRRWMTFRKD
jgi:alpha-ketoglutarate-dependent taurine dioxygenase